MKKLLILLTLGLMFGQTKLETRLYDYQYDSTSDEINLDILTGYEIDYAFVEVLKIEDANCNAQNYCNFVLNFDAGSLTQLQAGSGYWFKSSIEACFNYDCEEN